MKTYKKNGIILTAIIVVNMAVFGFSGIAYASVCSELAKVGITCSEDATTSFTEFTGGLQAPSTEGYDQGLTKATNARDFILNVTNFFLGFLGLIAVVVIIYGGFMYVTAMGKEEQTKKGKQAVTFSIIGILIILGSYAIVNTILQAPTGTDTGGLSGSATAPTGTSDINQTRRVLFNFAGTEVQSIARDFVTAYQNYIEVKNAIIELENIPQVKVSGDLRAMLDHKKSVVSQIKNAAGALSKVNEGVTKVENVLDKYLQLSSAELARVANDETEWYEFWNDGSEEFQTELTAATGETGLRGFNQSDFAYAVVKYKQRLDDLRERVTRIISLPEVDAAFTTATGTLNAITTGTDNGATLVNPDLGNTDILNVVESLSALYKQIKDIQFIYAVIHADITEGSAPLLVNFDALKSADPLNRTIPAQNYSWEFNDRNAVSEGPTQVHTFESPGSYMVKLTVNPPTQAAADSAVASGIAYVKIIVKEPVIKIDLDATVGENIFPLRKYDATGKMILDVNTIKITPAEAQGTITFDASKTGSERVRTVRWSSSGAGPEKVSGQTQGGSETVELTQDFSFPGPGNYKVMVEITDNLGNTDRKIVNVIVGTPIARVTITPNTEIGVSQEVTLDGGSSASEGAQITSYEWQPNMSTGVVFRSVDKMNTAKITGQYLTPGIHPLKLAVTDSLGNSDTQEMDLIVTSKPPVALFSYSIPDDKQPGKVILNANQSYDPDNTGVMTYNWAVDNVDDPTDKSFDSFTTANANNATPIVSFAKKGTYKVTLQVTNTPAGGTGETSDTIEREITIDNVLDVAMVINENKGATGILELNKDTNSLESQMTFTIKSENAVAYEIDFGDGEKEQGDLAKSKTVTHKYKETGTFNAKVSVFDAEDNENSLTRKVIIGSSTSPVAIIKVLVNGNEAVSEPGQPIKVNRKDTVTFDAGDSKNVDGTGRRLTYSWVFTPGEPNSKVQFTKIFGDLGSYNIKLAVKNENDLSMTGIPDTQIIEVVSVPPALKGLTAVPMTSSLVTPATVKVSAIGAQDLDGKIATYRWWYFDKSDPNEELGVQMTSDPSATITIGTRGETDEQKTYQFAVEITDQENTKVDSRDILPAGMWPELTITNGPNKAPIAKFNVDRTTVFTGESIEFASSSTDPDGTITSYYWDWEGNGFADNTVSEGSNVTHTFLAPAKDGIKVKLKVVDNNQSESVSSPVTIYVDSKAAAPVASFTSEQQGTTKTVKFTNTSIIDTANGANLAKTEWDFDVSAGASIDSTDNNPTKDYADYAIYRVKIIVTDSNGATNSATNYVNLKAPAPVTTQQTQQTQQPAPVLDARLLTTPAASFVDNKIHLTGQSQNVTLDFSTSTGNIKKYIIDKNVYFDTNGNGIKDDDEDYTATAAGKWTTNFAKTYGSIRVKLTVIDDKNKKDSVEKDMVFDATAGSTYQADIFGAADAGSAALIVSAIGFAILFIRKKFNK